MNLTQAWLIFIKEMRETIRDRRTLVAIIGVPLLLYPLLAIGTTQLVQMQMAALLKETIRLGLVGEDPALISELVQEDGLLGNLVRDKRIELLHEIGGLPGKEMTPEQAIAAVRRGEVDVVLQIDRAPTADGPLPIILHYTITEDRSSTARGRLLEMLRRVYLNAARARLSLQQLTFDQLAPMALESRNADPQLRGGFVFGRMMALLLVMLAVTFPFHPAWTSPPARRSEERWRRCWSARPGARRSSSASTWPSLPSV